MADLPPLREVIARHGLSASKGLGQNFLFDEQLLDRIAAVPGDLSGKPVLEVIAAKLSINDLLALTATCRELRGGLEDVRLTRTEGLIVKYHEKMRRDSNIAVWN